MHNLLELLELAVLCHAQMLPGAAVSMLLGAAASTGFSGWGTCVESLPDAMHAYVHCINVRITGQRPVHVPSSWQMYWPGMIATFVAGDGSIGTEAISVDRVRALCVSPKRGSSQRYCERTCMYSCLLALMQ